jgi:hypothetical protein
MNININIKLAHNLQLSNAINTMEIAPKAIVMRYLVSSPVQFQSRLDESTFESLGPRKNEEGVVVVVFYNLWLYRKIRSSSSVVNIFRQFTSCDLFILQEPMWK